MRRPKTIATALALAAALSAIPAGAQNMFAPMARVGDQVVTAYELDQRVAFNRALSAPGDLEALALEQLIEDRLRLIAAGLDDIDPTEEEVTEGMEEFASRANLSLDAFLAEIARFDVAEETFRDFVRAGLAYRLVVQERFGPLVGRSVGEAEVERAIARVEPRGRLEALLAEIILPADTPEREAEALRLAGELKSITSFERFSEAARRISFAATRDVGGRLDPLPLEGLPATIQAQLLSLSPGEVSDPIPLPGALVVFQLRGLEETTAAPAPPKAIDYAALYLPGGRSAQALAEAAAIDARVDDCDDLYGVARDLPPERLERGTRALDAIPADVAAQLALLDPGEVSLALTRAGGRTLVFLMLCGRDPLPEADEGAIGFEREPDSVTAQAASDEETAGEETAGEELAGAGETADAEGEAEAPPPELVAAQIRSARLQSFADAYLDELRAEAGVEILGRP